jgi:hypothetical protein
MQQLPPQDALGGPRTYQHHSHLMPLSNSRFARHVLLGTEEYSINPNAKSDLWNCN